VNNLSGSAITQQMYTRERRGIYRSTEGFDTVAKSESLDNNFVKKILHPFCLYDAPSELAARGEKDESQYPPALHLFHTENGETVIGQSRYLAADFTGQRSAFFAHNFVVPAVRSDEILRRYEDWLHADFADELGGEPGVYLPELSEIPVRRRGPRRDPITVLQSLGIGEVMFKSLLQATIASIAGKKKIYISLDVPTSELSARAVELTEIMYSVLPYEFRRRLGVVTYANEPKNRKYIHLTFVEKGAMRQGDRSIEKDFLFDLVSGRTANTDTGEQRQPYTDLVWRFLGRNPAALEDFAAFADKMLGGENVERKVSLGAYNELAVFYEIEQGNEALYEENKSAVLSGLLSYLKPEGTLTSRVRLNDLFLERFDREFDLIRQKGILVPNIMESFKEYFLLQGHTYRSRIVDYFINGLLNCQTAGLRNEVHAAYAVIESNEELSKAFFTRLLAQPDFRRILFEPYIESRLAAMRQAADVMSFVIRWGRFLPEALQLAFVRDEVRDYLLEKLQREKEPVGAVAAIHDTVTKVEKERRKGLGIGGDTLALLQSLASAADRFLLQHISLEEMSQEQLLDISFVRYPSEVAEWSPPLDYLNKRKSKVLRAAYRWFGEEKPNELIFAELSPQELDDVQLLGRRWLKEAQGAEPFEQLPLAFFYSSEREGGPLDYDALLDLVRSKAGSNKDTVYRFFAWSQGNSLFTLSGKKLQPGYRRALLKYFLNHDREAFKNREFRKGYAAAAGPALAGVYSEARAQLASPMARWLRRSRFQLMISGSILGIILIVALILFRALGSGGQETALPAVSPTPAASSGNGGVGAGIAPAAVYLKNADGSSEEEVSRLLFVFAAANDYAEFNPSEISVESSGGVTESYKVSATTKLNATPSADAGGSSEAPGTDNLPSASASSQPDETSSPVGNSPYQVEVALESNPALVKGSVIKAGGYTLTLMAAADELPGVEPSADTAAEASATPASDTP
jgi:hypothetical protein